MAASATSPTSTPNLFPLQYRTFERVYTVKVKAPSPNSGFTLSGLTIKVLSLSQEYLTKVFISERAMNSQPLGEEASALLHRSIAQRTPAPLFRILFEKNLLPKSPLSDLAQAVLPKEAFDGAAEGGPGAAQAGAAQVVASDGGSPEKLEELKRSLLTLIKKAETSQRPSIRGASIEEIDGFFCPITRTLLENPVQDEHGHTFEKSAIDEHLRRNGNECPITREEIRKLVPNRAIKDAIEAMQKRGEMLTKKSIIPTFALFQRERTNLANKYLKMARDLITEEEYEEAVESYTKVFQYTNDWKLYKDLPLLYQKMNEEGKAHLAVLYLALYQLEAGDMTPATQTLEGIYSSAGAADGTSQDGGRSVPPQGLFSKEERDVFSHLYQLQGEPQKELQLLASSSDELTEEERYRAITLTKEFLIREPHNYGMYSSLVNLLPAGQASEKAAILLKGALHALEQGEQGIATTFLAEVKELTPQDLTLLDHQIELEAQGLLQEGKEPELKTELQALQQLYNQTPSKSISQIKSFHKLLLKLEEDPEQKQVMMEAFRTASLSVNAQTLPEAGVAAATEAAPPKRLLP